MELADLQVAIYYLPQQEWRGSGRSMLNPAGILFCSGHCWRGWTWVEQWTRPPLGLRLIKFFSIMLSCFFSLVCFEKRKVNRFGIHFGILRRRQTGTKNCQKNGFFIEKRPKNQWFTPIWKQINAHDSEVANTYCFEIQCFASIQKCTRRPIWPCQLKAMDTGV